MSVPPRLRTPPWSQNELRALGKALRDGTVLPAKAPDYEDILAWYLDFAGDVLQHLERLDWTPLGLTATPGTSRPKTIGTLVEKLRRNRSTPLQNVGDLAGVRIDADMTLTFKQVLPNPFQEQSAMRSVPKMSLSKISEMENIAAIGPSMFLRNTRPAGAKFSFAHSCRARGRTPTSFSQ